MKKQQPQSLSSILVPTDFTSVSINALVYAAVLARKTGATITLFNAYQPFIANSMMSQRRKDEESKLFRKESLKELKIVRNTLMFKGKVQCKVLNREGVATDEILSICEERKPDLLLMGTQSRSAIDKVIFGNVVGTVVKGATAPVLVVPENTPFGVPRKIAFAVDYHDNDIHSLKYLTQLAHLFGAEITILHVADDTDYEKSYLKNFKTDLEQKIPDQKFIYKLIKGKNIGKALHRYTDKVGIDFLAVAKAHKSLLARMFKGSISRQLFLHTHIPLLILQAEDEDVYGI